MGLTKEEKKEKNRKKKKKTGLNVPAGSLRNWGSQDKYGANLATPIVHSGCDRTAAAGATQRVAAISPIFSPLAPLQPHLSLLLSLEAFPIQP